MEIIQVRRKARPTISFQYEKDGNNSNGNKGQDPSFSIFPSSPILHEKRIGTSP
jgi:hypothetical protein